MRKTLITPATFKPMEVEAIKIRPELHLTGSGSDLIIADHLESAIQAYQEYTDNILCRSTWDLYFDSFPDCEFELPAPLVSATISYLDTSGVSQPVASSVYTVDVASNLYGRIGLKYGQTWPSACEQASAVTIRAVIGYANAASIPQRIKDWLLLKIGDIYYGTDIAEERKWAMLASFKRFHI